METKITAVEWLALYIKGITNLNCDEVIDQAKAMEKEQIITFAKLWEKKLLDGRIDSVDDLYNETYGDAE
jgi:hypothetical protein